MASKESEQRLSLKMTGVERQFVLNELSSLSEPIKRVIRDAPQGKPVLMSRQQLTTFLLQLAGGLQRPSSIVHVKTWDAIAKRIQRLDSALDTGSQAPAVPLKCEPSSEVYQFKITLLNTKPPVWRRIQIQDCTLSTLHSYIQAAMGWEDDHLYEFDVKGTTYMPNPQESMFNANSTRDAEHTLVSEILPASHRKRFKFKYTYDLGDCWTHEVMFEGIVPADADNQYPNCREGARACPPEDIGGVYGYHELLVEIDERAAAASKSAGATSDSDHDAEEDDDMEWYGDFSPDEFDPSQATEALRQVASRTS